MAADAPGPLRRQDISSHDINYKEYVCPCLNWGRISTTCVISVKIFAHKGLIMKFNFWSYDTYWESKRLYYVDMWYVCVCGYLFSLIDFDHHAFANMCVSCKI